MYPSVLYYAFACHFDYLHWEINLDTSTFTIDLVSMCMHACACVCVYKREREGGRGEGGRGGEQEAVKAGGTIRYLTEEIFESAS